MLLDRLAQDLYAEICHIPVIDVHSHIDPRRPTAQGLEDILSYHYYTELAHSSGMDLAAIAPGVEPRERIRAVLYQMSCFDNTAPAVWLLEIARAFLDFQGTRITLADCGWLCDRAERLMGSSGWEERVLRQSNIEKVFLTNDFDDSLEGFDTTRYVPCLRADDLVFGLGRPEVRQRLARATGMEAECLTTLRTALGAIFERFTARGARACAVSLPPDFIPGPVPVSDSEKAFAALCRGDPDAGDTAARAAFWTLAELCRDFHLPFALMTGINRRVYEHGVPQGQDLFDQRTSLAHYAPLFNAFPRVTFCVSVLSSSQNQELVSYAWIFPNVVTAGHWWYSSVPAYVAQDARARLQAVPKTKQIGYFSDMYKLEFGLPKYNMYRRILAQLLADDYVRPRVYTRPQAIELARLLLRDNARRIFGV